VKRALLATAVALALPFPGSAAAQEPTDPARPAAPAPVSPEVEGQVRKVVDQARADLATRPRGPTLARAQGDWGARLAALGPDAAPALAAALGREEDAAVAGAIEKALLAYPSLVPAGPLVDAVATRRLSATAPLVRAAGVFGGEEGARQALSLLDESEREARQLTSKFTGDAPARLEALRILRNAAVDALGACDGFAPGLERLLALLEETARPAGLAGPDPERVREALALALRRGLDGDGDAAAAPRAALSAALGRTGGARLAALLEVAGGVRLPGLVEAAGRAISEAETVPHDRGTRSALRSAAAGALRPYVVATDGPPADPAAIAHYLRLLSADDEALRLAVVLDLGFSRSSAVLPRLVDAYESDPSQDVRTQAHASLVRLAGGVNLGDPDDWREWYGGRR